MRPLLATALFALSIASVNPSWAEKVNVRLSLPTMNCPSCPIAVKTALKNIDGVSAMAVNYRTQSALVTFDDSKTTVDALIAATTNAGFPATVVEH